MGKPRLPPDFFSLTPSELHTKEGNGGASNGPTVCSSSTSLAIAVERISAWIMADEVLVVKDEVREPQWPISAPKRRISTIDLTKGRLG